MAGFKFAALILPTNMGPTGSRMIHAGKETLITSISKLIAPEELADWRERVGSIAWDKIDSEKRLVIIRATAGAPAVLDADSDRYRGT